MDSQFFGEIVEYRLVQRKIMAVPDRRIMLLAYLKKQRTLSADIRKIKVVLKKINSNDLNELRAQANEFRVKLEPLRIRLLNITEERWRFNSLATKEHEFWTMSGQKIEKIAKQWAFCNKLIRLLDLKMVTLILEQEGSRSSEEEGAGEGSENTAIVVIVEKKPNPDVTKSPFASITVKDIKTLEKTYSELLMFEASLNQLHQNNKKYAGEHDLLVAHLRACEEKLFALHALRDKEDGEKTHRGPETVRVRGVKIKVTKIEKRPVKFGADAVNETMFAKIEAPLTPKDMKLLDEKSTRNELLKFLKIKYLTGKKCELRYKVMANYILWKTLCEAAQVSEDGADYFRLLGVWAYSATDRAISWVEEGLLLMFFLTNPKDDLFKDQRFMAWFSTVLTKRWRSHKNDVGDERETEFSNFGLSAGDGGPSKAFFETFIKKCQNQQGLLTALQGKTEHFVEIEGSEISFVGKQGKISWVGKGLGLLISLKHGTELKNCSFEIKKKLYVVASIKDKRKTKTRHKKNKVLTIKLKLKSGKVKKSGEEKKPKKNSTNPQDSLLKSQIGSTRVENLLLDTVDRWEKTKERAARIREEKKVERELTRERVAKIREQKKIKKEIRKAGSFLEYQEKMNAEVMDELFGPGGPTD